VLGLTLVYSNLNAAEGERRGGGMRTPPTVEQIEERIGAKLTDEQKTKVTAIHAEVVKKDAELEAKDEVKKLREEMKNATPENRRELFGKLREAKGGYDAIAEMKKGLAGVLNEEQLGKAFPQRGGQRGGGDRPGGEKKEGGDKPAEKKAE
jgi:hypothetical protein